MIFKGFLYFKIGYEYVAFKCFIYFQNCKVETTAGTGYGKVASVYGSKVRTATWTECKNAMNS